MIQENRLGRDKMFMYMARLAAERSTCIRKKVGVLIVNDGRPISIGYCGAPPNMDHCIQVGCKIGPNDGCIRSIHAEANAIGWAARQGLITLGSTMYTTCTPCRSCAQLIISAGINTLYYYEPYRDTSGLELLAKAGIILTQLIPQQGENSYDIGRLSELYTGAIVTWQPDRTPEFKIKSE